MATFIGPMQSVWDIALIHTYTQVRTLVIVPFTGVRLVTSSAFTISEMAADWHEPMVLQRIM